MQYVVFSFFQICLIKQRKFRAFIGVLFNMIALVDIEASRNNYSRGNGEAMRTSRFSYTLF